MMSKNFILFPGVLPRGSHGMEGNTSVPSRCIQPHASCIPAVQTPAGPSPPQPQVGAEDREGTFLPQPRCMSAAVSLQQGYVDR